MGRIGLSPRVRGNLRRVPHRRIRAWSIPACTGKPCVLPTAPRENPVYPRVYGETNPIDPKLLAINGLSPRVRGNHCGSGAWSVQIGSIPACTGKPTPASESDTYRPVYPRVYGETRSLNDSAIGRSGLSPRVRGNPYSHIRLLPNYGSIPACTGKPYLCHTRLRPIWVYPRVYGETAWCRQLKVKLSIGLRYRFYTFPSFLIFSKKTNGT